MKELKARTIIEVLGRPKEHVDKTLSLVKENLSKSKNLSVVKSEIFQGEPLKDHENMFTGFIETDIKVKDLDKLIGFCFDFMPSSVEVLDPDNVGMKSTDINNMLNDLLAKMHQYDMAMKNMYAQNILLKRRVDELVMEKEKSKETGERAETKEEEPKKTKKKKGKPISDS